MITVVVDRFSKMAHFIPSKNGDTASDVAARFRDSVMRLHGAPESIVSDRDTKFTGKFWTSLMSLLGVKLKMSTAFHPQSDGQTERTNRTLEQYLRNYVDYDQKNWDTCLSAAEFAYNSAQHSSTGLSPFEVCTGRSLSVAPFAQKTPLLNEEAVAPAAKEFIDRFSTLLGIARDRLLRAQQQQAAAVNQHRTRVSFEVGDLVLLSTENLRKDIPDGAKVKLTGRRIGPLKVLRVGLGDSYELELPAAYKSVHPVFHVSLLEKYVASPPEFTARIPTRPPPVIVAGAQEFEVEKIAKSSRLFEIITSLLPSRQISLSRLHCVTLGYTLH